MQDMWLKEKSMGKLWQQLFLKNNIGAVSWKWIQSGKNATRI